MVQVNPPTVSPTDPTPEELAAKKAKKKEKNKKQALKRKEKKAEKKKEAEEAKSAAAGRETPPLPPLAASSSSSSEEDSPRKSPVRSRTTRVLGDTAKKSLFQYLNTISEDEGEKLGEEIERCYRAKTASDVNEDTAVIFADLHNKLAGGKKSREIAVMDSG